MKFTYQSGQGNTQIRGGVLISNNLCVCFSTNRMKRDHQKRLEAAANARTAEPHGKGPYGPLGVNVSATATASLGRATSPNALGSASVAQVDSQGGEMVGEDAPSGYNSGDEHHGRDAGLTENEWKQRDEEFVKVMAKEGLIVKEIEEDGACLFRSISLQIYGDQDMHEDIRQQTMDYIVSDFISIAYYD